MLDFVLDTPFFASDFVHAKPDCILVITVQVAYLPTEGLLFRFSLWPEISVEVPLPLWSQCLAYISENYQLTFIKGRLKEIMYWCKYSYERTFIHLMVSISLFQYPKVYGIEFTWQNLIDKLDLQECNRYNASGIYLSECLMDEVYLYSVVSAFLASFSP